MIAWGCAARTHEDEFRDLRVPRIPSVPSTWTFAGAGCGRRIGVALSFLYLECLRMLQFLRLRRDDRAGVAIEVVMAGHEVSVLVRQVEHLSLLTGSP